MTNAGQKVVPIEGGRAKDVTPTPPRDLPADQRQFWRDNAGLAIAAGTLTKQTEAAFRLLCELDAERRKTKDVIDKDGRTYVRLAADSEGKQHVVEVKVHPLTSTYRQLAKNVEALLARFSLAPFGKPVAGFGPKKSTVNPWVSIASAGKNAKP